MQPATCTTSDACRVVRAGNVSTSGGLSALRFDADPIMYTDGSKQGPSITAAWIQPSTMAGQSLIVGGSALPQRTPVRAELVALHAVVHSHSFPPDQPLTMMTDSLTSQQLVATNL